MKMKGNAQLVFWITLGVSLVGLVLNLWLLSQHDDPASRHWRSEFLQKSISILPGNHVDPRSVGAFSDTSYPQTADTTNTLKEFRRSRTLVGILTADSRPDYYYRRRHRELFQIWNDTRVCSLGELRRMPALRRKQCQLVYTFVLGAATDPNSPTLVVNTSIPLFRDGPFPSKHSDVNQDDVTLLNIKYVYPRIIINVICFAANATQV